MAERVAIYLQDAHDLLEGRELAKYAESRGFEAVWQAESRLVRDAIVPMAAFAAVTDKLKVGSGVINNWTRNIGLLAATFLTLDDLAPNRVICGIGAWWDPLAKNVGVEATPADKMGLDIGEATRKAYGDIIASAQTIIWNGPMGMFEKPPFDIGTRAVAQAVVEASEKSDATSIIGGGDSVAAIQETGLADKITHISTGGGATLELLAGDTLPGVAALSEK